MCAGAQRDEGAIVERGGVDGKRGGAGEAVTRSADGSGGGGCVSLVEGTKFGDVSTIRHAEGHQGGTPSSGGAPGTAGGVAMMTAVEYLRGASGGRWVQPKHKPARRYDEETSPTFPERRCSARVECLGRQS